MTASKAIVLPRSKPSKANQGNIDLVVKITRIPEATVRQALGGTRTVFDGNSPYELTPTVAFDGLKMLSEFLGEATSTCHDSEHIQSWLVSVDDNAAKWAGRHDTANPDARVLGCYDRSRDVHVMWPLLARPLKRTTVDHVLYVLKEDRQLPMEILLLVNGRRMSKEQRDTVKARLAYKATRRANLYDPTFLQARFQLSRLSHEVPLVPLNAEKLLSYPLYEFTHFTRGIYTERMLPEHGIQTAHALGAALGNNLDDWMTFAALAPHWSGSIQEAINTIRDL